MAGIGQPAALHLPGQAVLRMGIHAAVLLAADVAIHILGDHVHAVGVAPDEGVLQHGVAREQRLLAAGGVGAFPAGGGGGAEHHRPVDVAAGIVRAGQHAAALVHHRHAAVRTNAGGRVGGEHVVEMVGTGGEDGGVPAGPGAEHAGSGGDAHPLVGAGHVGAQVVVLHLVVVLRGRERIGGADVVQHVGVPLPGDVGIVDAHAVPVLLAARGEHHLLEGVGAFGAVGHGAHDLAAEQPARMHRLGLFPAGGEQMISAILAFDGRAAPHPVAFHPEAAIHRRGQHFACKVDHSCFSFFILVLIIRHTIPLIFRASIAQPAPLVIVHQA